MMKNTVLFCIISLLSLSHLDAQEVQYPSLLWEITGNGLAKPSYLFGTMHVSSKLAFHLSDSFYLALESADVVALEQNPLHWQGDMAKAEAEQAALNTYLHNGANRYINEQSFALSRYEELIATALSQDPQVVNSLLYRNSDTKEDFEENTYLDLYIYQAARKLGKRAAGVEDYAESKRLVAEAYQDALEERLRTNRFSNGEEVGDLQNKIQTAYRQGNLDLLDSLEKFEFSSPAFIEKFLYRRNEIQAHSIDTLLQRHSLFAGVGAAHLPGARGVIELLRKKGYTLRPVFMQKRNAALSEKIDKMKVPVQFEPTMMGDNEMKIEAPGRMYQRNEAGTPNESWQYADMQNGAYYSIVRVRTWAALLGDDVNKVLQKTDSLLYENVPGKIVSKTVSEMHGVPVISLANRTRRGDMQRYQIYILPFEVVICKVSGNNEYALGKESNHFFNSVQIMPPAGTQKLYTSSEAGFTALFPQQPYRYAATDPADRTPACRFAAVDSFSGNAVFVWKKTVNNYHFLEEDTFDVGLIEESLRRSDVVHKKLRQAFVTQNGYAAARSLFLLRSGYYLHTLCVVRGAHYYVVGAITKKEKDKTATRFLHSFSLTPFVTSATTQFRDSALLFHVAAPDIGVNSDRLLLARRQADQKNGYPFVGDASYGSGQQTAFFVNGKTGEAVLVTCTTYPAYFKAGDSAAFWKKELQPDQYKAYRMVMAQLPKRPDGSAGYRVTIRDTGTSRQLIFLYLLQQNRLYRLSALTDTLRGESAFIEQFYNSFTTEKAKGNASVFTPKEEMFFSDYDNPDSARHAMALQALGNLSLSCHALPFLQERIAALNTGHTNYMQTKRLFIRQLGNMATTDCVSGIESVLNKIADQTKDTAAFQNEITLALARLATQSSFDTLRIRLTDDTPLFNSGEEYKELFHLLSDSLFLAKRLFPAILPLTTIDDYKTEVNKLLLQLLDSGLVQPADYASHFSLLYFDARLALKRLQMNDEQQIQRETEVSPSPFEPAHELGKAQIDELIGYARLLLPFYDAKAAVSAYFERLMTSKNAMVQKEAALLLAKQNRHVPDTLWRYLAQKDKYRADLLKQLTAIQKPQLFPAAENTREKIAVSLLLKDAPQEYFYQTEIAEQREVQALDQKGIVYFIKYKWTKDEDWKIGISGLFSLDKTKTDILLPMAKLTQKNVIKGEPLLPQFEDQLLQVLYSLHHSSFGFFAKRQNGYRSFRSFHP